MSVPAVSQLWILHSGTHTHLIKPQLFNTIPPNQTAQVDIEVLGNIPETSQVLPQHNDQVGAHLPGFLDALQFIQAPATGFIVASHDNLFLLDGQGS